MPKSPQPEVRITLKVAETIYNAKYLGCDFKTLEIEVDSLSQVSDGYHTIQELYDHRIALYIALCRWVRYESNPGCSHVWRSLRHSDGEVCFGTGTQFIMGIGKEKGSQISYHLPMSYWNQTDFAETLERAPEWDGHTSADVLERLKSL